MCALPNGSALIEPPLAYDDALVISLTRYGETDCIVRLFTRQAGRMTAFFKRGSHSHIVVLGLARISFIMGSAERMTRLRSIESDPRSLGLASSLRLFAYSAYVAELVEKLLPEHEVAEPVFKLILE